MSRSQCQVLAPAPTPVSLRWLNEALRPFRSSYHGTRIVIETFLQLINNVHPEAGTAQTHVRWQKALSDLRDPHHVDHRDPESLQVAQVLSRLPCLEVMAELFEKLKHCNGNPWSSYKSRLGGYSSVTRCQDWLVGCARLADGNSSSDLTFKDHLEHLSWPQPEYGDVDYTSSFDTEDEALYIFGPKGVLLPAMEYATQNSKGDSSLIEAVVDIIMREVMTVADIWTYTLEHGIRPVGAQPSYSWYLRGLTTARNAFKDRVRDYSDSGACHLPFELRDILKSVSFVAIWDSAWRLANAMGISGDATTHGWHVCMYVMVHLWLNDPDVFPLSEDAAVLLRDVQVKLKSRDLANLKPGPFRPKNCPCRIDFETIEHSENFEVECYWGRRFYPNLEGLNVLESAQEVPDENVPLEVCGHHIEPMHYADLTTEESYPTDQNCTICAEDFTGPSDETTCIKLDSCGHYFHYECIDTWMNGVAVNSNRCPECRQEICEYRRPVRPIDPGRFPRGAMDDDALTADADDEDEL
ncbi:hypothetical protein FB567DRAFT_610209 [Paraphoma chrysanthemicola]|uniref:RING-type domain-containing protein n=1 Tax=Paraphoma chrysanthemicola TaxID=798071 RepID=A0A8K0REZ3_9PLEO|nr:hypothetical protein FB567DRAFT_610209 [Paraphoma chrysanthemicola]